MKCKYCKKEMDFVTCNDSPNDGFAYNVYHCFSCMVLLKEDVWNNPGKIWITMRNDVEIETKDNEVRRKYD